jgi:RNA polymerase sigma factor (sigma-70 family)
MSTHDINEEPSDRDVDAAAELDALSLYVREVETRSRITREEETRIAEEIVECRRDIVTTLRALVLEAADALALDAGVARRLRDELAAPASERKLERLERRIHAVVAAARRAGEALRRGDRSEPRDRIRDAGRLLADIARGFGVTPEVLERVAEEIGEKRQRIAAAKQRLVEANLRLVVYFARRMKWRGVDTVDLVQEGNIALLRAVDSYDPKRGFAFGSFACTAIRRAMTRFGSAASRPVHVPSEVQSRRYRIRNTERYLTTRNGVAPSWEAIAEYLGVTMADVIDALDNREESVSLDAEIDEGMSIIGRLADDATPEASETIAIAQADRHARETVAGLDARERKILASRFDLDESGAATLAEVGRDLGVTRERARQLEARALGQLRTRSAAARRRGGRRPLHSATGKKRTS